ncbi:MAG: hypothetical protein KDN20_24525 [Verrucomicrobiae bacterium]|nr:hypothetical protein [Verrucomicrobiae bacterium]
MENIYWSFGWKQYDSRDEFIRAVQEECDHVSPEGHGWNPQDHVCHGPLSIEFELMWKDPPDDMIYFEITTENRPLTQGEILHELNEQSFDFFKDKDHRFFEGFGDLIDGRMYLVTGS